MICGILMQDKISSSPVCISNLAFRGDPDKADYFGNTALHLASAQGHKAVVTFLVNFGANIYAMDIDGHNPQELAGINNRDEILRYLDGVAAKLEAGDKKKTKALKEKARKDAEKRVRVRVCLGIRSMKKGLTSGLFQEFNKRQAKADAAAHKYQKRLNQENKSSVMNTLKLRIKSPSMSNLLQAGQQPPRNSFSAIAGGGTVSHSKGITGTVQRKIKNKIANNEDDFKVTISHYSNHT